LTPKVAAAAYGAGLDADIRELGRELFRSRSRPPLAEWAEANRRWPDGKLYRLDETPHMREILEAYSDPAVEEIVVIKPAQSGLTEGLYVNGVGYHIDVDPRAILIVLPTLPDARKFSLEKMQPMIDATPSVRGRLNEGSRKSSDTMIHKTFAGGRVSLTGAVSARGFRMISVGTVFADDVNGWDSTAGKGAASEGDQTVLIRRRASRAATRKLVWGSTPTDPRGRVSLLYRNTERRGEFKVPCPECGTWQTLRWGGPGEQWGLKWETEEVGRDYEPEPGEVLRRSRVHRPDTVYYRCREGCRIEEDAKPEMEARGEYRTATGERVIGHGAQSLGFWLRGPLTMTLPGSEWAALVREFLGVVDDPTKLQAYWNTVLAEEWVLRGEAPEWRRIYERREDYPMKRAPDGALMLTVGVDVQHTWIVADVWAWGWDRESWLVDDIVIEGDLKDAAVRAELTRVLLSSYPSETGDLPIAGLAIDAADRPDVVMAWARAVGDPRVMCVKGMSDTSQWTTILGTPKRTEVTYSGKRTGMMLWPMGSALIKQETYGFLTLDPPVDGAEYPPGYIHIPYVDDEWCRQIVAEDLVLKGDRREWVPNRHRNERLDCRSMARAAAERLGLARMVGPRPEERPKRRAKRDDALDDRQPREGHGGDGKWLGGGGRRRRGRWLDR
jgi:phage terminase large subunit GpA-like protein